MTASEYIQKIDEAAAFISSRDPRRPEVAIILGSGLGKLADEITEKTVIPYAEIPGFPVSTAIGHKGNLIIGLLGGRLVLAMQGRFHAYEGYDMWQITMPERVMSILGVKYLFVSNAAGGMNPSFSVGDIMLINDHINFAPNPLIGPNLDKFGPRFPDMTCPYDKGLCELAESSAEELGLKLQEGVYVIVTGPCYETPAELRFFAKIGGDAIGMSTVPEVIVARHCGMRVMGVSVITDIATGYPVEGYVTDGEEIVKAADAAADRMTALFTHVIGRL